MTRAFIPELDFTIPEEYTLNVDRIMRVFAWVAADQRFLDQVENGTIVLSEALKDVTWNQGDWANQQRNGFCKTSCCFAGAAVMDAGYLPVMTVDAIDFVKTPLGLEWENKYDMADVQSDDIPHEVIKTVYESAESCAPAVTAFDPNGKTIKVPSPNEDEYEGIDDKAQELLGITDYESNALFNGGNRFGDLSRVLMGIFQARGLNFRDALRTANIPVPPQTARVSERTAWSMYGSNFRNQMKHEVVSLSI